MRAFSNVLLVICLLGFALGLADVGGAMISGMTRAIGAVFFILYFISRMALLFSDETPSRH
jgi:hypothetical protein